MEGTYIVIGLTFIILLGMLAQWLAWRFQLPSILILLLFGFLAGPITGLIHPELIFGKLFFPIISISVAIILFEGGLELRFRELPEVGGVVRNLVTVGAAITWLLIAYAAYKILHMEISIALLLGAILVVTGPTVIGPLLRQMRPVSSVSSVLKWEGITIDPIGAILAVLVFEAIVSGKVTGDFQETIFGTGQSLLKTFFAGSVIGFLGAVFLLIMLKHYWIPDFLQSPASLMVVIIVFTVSNIFQREAGLLATTVMGITLANQKQVSLKRIVEFKESLRVLLISSLFIILAAGLQLSDFRQINLNTLLFLFVIIFIIRPIVVAVSTLGSKLDFKKRLFIAWMAPRGIVAAAVASLFAYELEHLGYTNATQLIPTTFFVIIGTVSIYGLTAPWVAKKLNLANPNPQGILVVGAHYWARALMKILKEEGFRIEFVDTNRANISAARMEGFTVSEKNILSQTEADEIDLEGVGRLFALTPNDEVNSLAAIRFSKIFGAKEVYQLAPKKKKESDEKDKKESDDLRARYLFDETATYFDLDALFRAGAEVKKTNLTKEFDFKDFQAHYRELALPLFLISPNKEINVFTVDKPITPKAGLTLISLTFPDKNKPDKDLEQP